MHEIVNENDYSCPFKLERTQPEASGGASYRSVLLHHYENWTKKDHLPMNMDGQTAPYHNIYLFVQTGVSKVINKPITP